MYNSNCAKITSSPTFTLLDSAQQFMVEVNASVTAKPWGQKVATMCVCLPPTKSFGTELCHQWMGVAGNQADFRRQWRHWLECPRDSVSSRPAGPTSLEDLILPCPTAQGTRTACLKPFPVSFFPREEQPTLEGILPTSITIWAFCLGREEKHQATCGLPVPDGCPEGNLLVLDCLCSQILQWSYNSCLFSHPSKGRFGSS